jgi:hypothetical protein
MLFLDFCNIENWNVDKITNLYECYRIIHTKDGENRGWEVYCKTKHKEKRFYFESAGNTKFMKDFPGYAISPSDPNFIELWKMLKRSQNECRSFLDNCIKGKLDLKFINNSSNRIFKHSLNNNPIQFIENLNGLWMPNISYTMQYLPDLESYVEWEVINLFLNRVKPLNIDHLRKCKKCNQYFLFVRTTKNFCSDKCRFSFHGKKDTESGKRKEYMKKARKKGLYLY